MWVLCNIKPHLVSKSPQQSLSVCLFVWLDSCLTVFPVQVPVGGSLGFDERLKIAATSP